MKMKKYVVFVIIALSIGFVSCSDDDEIPNPKLEITSETGEDAVAQLDTLYLSATTDLAKVNGYKWTVDGTEVSKEATYKFTNPKTGTFVIGLSVSGDNGEVLTMEKKVEVKSRFSDGAFVLNEGNMGNETGTLTYIDSEGVLIDSAYYHVNGTLLGNVCQDLFIADNKIYIISQNGARNGGEGLLTIARADNLEKEKVYNDASETLSWPTSVAVVGQDIYLRDNKGIYLLNASTETLTYVANSKGAAKARMAVVGNKVFAMNGSNIMVIENGAITGTITAPGKLSGIAKAYDGSLWASCSSPAKILKINITDYSIDAHDISESGLGAGWGVAPAFSATKDVLYFSNAGFNLYRHNFTENKTEFVTKISDHVEDAKMYYNSLGVNPKTGEVIYATLKGYGNDYKINDIAVFDFTKDPSLQHDFKGSNSFPAGVFFTSYF